MELTPEILRDLQALASLELSREEESALREDLSRILHWMSILEACKIDDVPPTVQLVTSPQPLRADEVQSSLPVEGALANAPERFENLFQVPRFVVRKGSP